MSDLAIGTMIGVSACTAGLSRLVGKLVDFSVAGMRSEFDKLQSQANIAGVLLRMDSIRKVKTLLDLENEMALESFYHPTHIDFSYSDEQVLEIEGDRSIVTHSTDRIRIDDFEDLRAGLRVVILGTVGQGKSIFMRYLCCKEISGGEKLPVFLELRNIEESQTLEDAILLEAKAYGFVISSDTLDHLLQYGFLALFLDGFDEVKEERKMSLKNQIEFLCKKYEKLQIVVSSRPKTGVESAVGFETRYVSQIGRTEYPDIIRRFIKNSSKAENLIKGLAKTRVVDLLNTPLMIALLVVRFRIEESIPENEIAFFDDLFLILVQRHDNYKGGFRRERLAPQLGDHRLRQVFCGVCVKRN